jgi:hypothetical protein
MARHLFFAITLIGTAVLLNSPAEAVTAARCEDQAAIAWADVPTPLVGRIRTNACATATGR